MSNQLPSPKILWVENVSSQYESTWIAIHRLLWLNCMSAGEFSAQIRKQEKEKWPMKSHTYSFEEAIEYLGGPFSKFAEAFTRKKSIYKEWHQPVRFCPECLRNGFHSKLFQIPYLENCPLHGQRLRDTCVACRCRLGEFSFNATGWPKNPLTCYSCKEPFFSRSLMAENVIDGYPEAEKVFDEVESLYWKIFGVEIVSRPFARHDDPFYARFEWEARLVISDTASSSLLSTARHWDFSSIETKESFSIEKKEERGVSHVPQDFAVERVRTAVQIIRSIDKQLSKNVRMICGHRFPEMMRHIDRYWRGNGIQHELQFEAHHCPCCATLQWWRHQVGLVFGFYRYCKHNGHDGWPGWKWSYISDLLSLDNRCLAASIWWLFAYMAQKMGIYIASVDRQQQDFKRHSVLTTDGSEFLSDSKNFSIPFGHIQLGIEEPGFPKIYVQAKFKDRYLAVGPSVRRALAKLEQCDALRHHGPFWRHRHTAQRGYIVRDKWCDLAVQRRNQGHW